MPLFLTFGRALAATFLTLLAGAALAQGPTVTILLPAADAPAAPANTAVTVTLNQALASSSAGALKVFSSQRGGLRSAGGGGAVSVRQNTVLFAPAYPFMPGEQVQATLTTAARSTSGAALLIPKVWRFTTATGGTGRGTFTGTARSVGGDFPISSVAGDVDNDGDLDLLVGSLPAKVAVCLNDGTGRFTRSQLVPCGNVPLAVATADLDNDGDLDLLTVNNGDSNVSVSLNNGAGVFATMPPVYVYSAPISLAVGDLDGDGDLDFVTGTSFNNFGLSDVSVRLNDGTGTFTRAPDVSLGLGPEQVALADFDHDGRLDLAVADRVSSVVNIVTGVGGGRFSTVRSTISLGPNLASLATGDVNGDGWVDLLVGQRTGGDVYVCRNSGTGTFTVSQIINAGSSSAPLYLADLNADGNPDIVAVTRNAGTFTVLTNDGSGAFARTPAQSVTPYLNGLTLADLDNDGDLDFSATSDTQVAYTYYLRFNGSQTPTATTAASGLVAFTLSPNPAHNAFTLTSLPAGTPVQVLDALGRPVLALALPANGTVVLPAGLAAGLYEVRAGGNTRRLAVE